MCAVAVSRHVRRSEWRWFDVLSVVAQVLRFITIPAVIIYSLA